MVTRKDVITCLIALTFIVVIINLLTIISFWHSNFENALRFTKSKNKLNPSMPTEMTHNKNDVISARFQIQEGQLQLITPEKLDESEVAAFQRSILSQIPEEVLFSRESIGGEAFIVRRIKRALGGIPQNQKLNIKRSPGEIWKNLAEWPESEKLLQDATLGETLRFMTHVKIVQAKLSARGTQLKLEFLMEGGEICIFKPAWYKKFPLVRGDPYGGKDRHFGEIAAFYLAQLLSLKTSPVVVGRKINLVTEIIPVGTRGLNETYFRNKDGNSCIYGSCHFCKKEDPVCGVGDEMEGALILHMKQKLKTVPNPWRRTYSKNTLSKWEKNMSFCNTAISELKESGHTNLNELILDIVTVAIFDFLIGNGDRHHFDFFTNTSTISSGNLFRIALIDNGKSFGDPDEDYIDILAPLYQCCIVRKEFWSTLAKFQKTLGKTLASLTVFDSLYPILNQDSLNALDRRLSIIFATYNSCQQRRNPKLFF